MAPEVSFPLDFASNDEKWMFIALLTGMNGVGIANPNPSVGCVILKNGQEVATGATEAYKFRHAERVAIESIPQTDLKGATAYVTLEPCSHQGHQPPCVDLLIQKKFSRVVIAASDPNPKVSGEGIRKLKENGVEVVMGTLGAEATLWHLPFLAHQLLGRPLYVGKWAESSNGLLASDDGESKWITNPISRAYGHWLRQKYDAVVVGSGTVLKDHPKLTVRDCRAPIERQPLRIVVDLKGRISDITPELLHTTFSDKTVTVLFSPKQPTHFPKESFWVRAQGTELVETVQNWIQSKEATDLFGKPLQSIYIEGGSTLLNAFLSKKSLDVLHVFKGAKNLTGNKYSVQWPKEDFELVTEAPLKEDKLQEFVSLNLTGKLK